MNRPNHLEPLWFMHCRPYPFPFGAIWIGLLGFLLVVSPALGQGPPPRIPPADIAANELSSEQIARIKAFVDHWTAPLLDAEATSEQVERASTELLSPWQGIKPTISNDFRYQYSKHALPPLEKALERKDEKRLHTASHAAKVIAQLGTDGALRALSTHSDARIQSCWQIRLRAAAGCEVVLQTDGLDPKKVLDAVRKLRDAVKDEADNLVLRRQFAAIDAADHNKLQQVDRQQIRAAMVEAIVAAVDRIVAQNNLQSAPPVDAVNLAIVFLRDKFISGLVQGAEAKTLGKSLGPSLGKLLAFAGTTWPTAQGDEKTKKLYATLIGTIEGFLPHIDGHVRGPGSPQTKLKDAWIAGDKPKFEADLKVWLDVFKQPAYAKT